MLKVAEKMLRYVLRRILYIGIVFLLLSFILFSLFQMVPGDPVAMQISDQAMSLSPEQYDKLYAETAARMGKDKSFMEQYLIWIGDILTGEYGRSAFHRMEVIDLVTVPMQNTISLNIITMALVFAIAIPLGVFTAVKKGTLFDKAVQGITIMSYGLPSFVIALGAIVIFAIIWPVFPISGSSTAGFVGTEWEMFVDRLYHMALPVLVMTFSSLTGIVRYVRAEMINVLRMDYIRTARAKGLKEKVVIYAHAFRNALIPVVTIMTGWFVGIFGGSVVIESIFAWNGIGGLLIDSLRQQDFTVVLALQMFYIFLGLISSLFLDIIYGFIDPRVKLVK